MRAPSSCRFEQAGTTCIFQCSSTTWRLDRPSNPGMSDELDKSLPVSSSQPPAFCQQQESLFREVIQLLEENRVPFVISGAFALHEHTGIWRDTKDLDLFLPAQEVARALELLKKDGFATEILDPVWLAKARRDGFFVDLITGMSSAVV